jgi:hypothetical protein
MSTLNDMLSVVLSGEGTWKVGALFINLDKQIDLGKHMYILKEKLTYISHGFFMHGLKPRSIILQIALWIMVARHLGSLFILS